MHSSSVSNTKVNVDIDFMQSDQCDFSIESFDFFYLCFVNSHLTFIQYSSNAIKPLSSLLTYWASQVLCDFQSMNGLPNIHCIGFGKIDDQSVCISFCSNMQSFRCWICKVFFHTIFMASFFRATFILHTPNSNTLYRVTYFCLHCESKNTGWDRMSNNAIKEIFVYQSIASLWIIMLTEAVTDHQTSNFGK